MCGICGIGLADPSRPLEPERLTRMRAAIGHRGPDGVGEHAEGGVALGHCRLAIIDVQGGQQPLSNEDHSLWVVLNGEIYNYRELTARLTRLGHTFRTRSDTEVVVHAYEEYGLDFVSHLNGMFALALHDMTRRRLILARDHLGIKPLFYSVSGEALFFASEIKGVLAGTGQAPRIRTAGLQEYLIFRYVAGAISFFEDVARVPPGHLALWEHGRLQLRRYWAPPAPDPRPRAAGLAEAADELDGRLAQAVGSQLMSDVPLGTFCSGGVDSGLVTAYAARATARPLSTFSVGFAEPGWDETALARDTASRLGCDHHVIVADAEAFTTLIPTLIRYHDEPLSHPNSVPLFLLSRFARDLVTVVLTGEGADELFGGYPRYHMARLRGASDGLPPWARQLMARLSGGLGRRGRKLAGALPLTLEDSVLFNSAYVHPDIVARVTGRPIDDALAERRTLLRDSVVPDDAVASLSRYELATYLGCALERMDRMSMASGLEARVPFLDVPLVEWSVRLTSAHKMGGVETKRVVKRVAARYLSRRVIRGPKSGFGLPLARWFRTPALSGLLARLRDRDHPAAVHFVSRHMDDVIGEHLRGTHDHSELLWLLSNVYLWYEVHGCGGESAPPLARVTSASSPRSHAVRVR